MKEINLLGIAGRAGSGKNTVAEMIQKIANGVWEQKAFAGKLKQIASLLTGIPIEKFEDQEFKEKTFVDLYEEGFISKSFYESLPD